MIYISIKVIPPKILKEYEKEAEKIIRDRKYEKWYYGYACNNHLYNNWNNKIKKYIGEDIVKDRITHGA
jgi:hypothetical protein